MKIEKAEDIALLKEKLAALKIPASFPLEVPDDSVAWHKQHLREPNQWPDHSEEENHAHGVARAIAHLPKPTKPKRDIVVEHHEHHHGPHWGWMVAIMILLILIAVRPARCQYSQINVITAQNQGTTVKSFASPFTLNCSTNMTCAISGNVLNLSASATGATAFSGITAATNSNAGNFVVSGGNWDFTAAGLLKLRIAAGLITATNGEVGYDTTNLNWHIWDNGVDSVIGVFPASLSITNGHLVTWSKSGNVLTLNDGGTATSGTVTNFTAGNLSPLFTSSVGTSSTTPSLTFTLSNAAANTIFGNFTGSSAGPSFNAVTACGDSSHALSWVAGTGFGCQAITGSGGGMTNPMTTLGDTIYEDATPTAARLAGNTTTTKKYLSQTGTGTVSAVPAWAQVAYGDLSGTPQLPQTISSVSHQWLNSYSATTGLFTQTQPAFSDVSGTATTAQLPGSGATTVNGQTCTLGSTCTVSGGTNSQTASYTLVAGDLGKLVVMNCSAACTVTLFGSPTAGYYGAIESIGSTVATVSLNSKNLNGTTLVPTLTTNQPIFYWSDGTNYFGDGPSGSGATCVQLHDTGTHTFSICGPSSGMTANATKTLPATGVAAGFERLDGSGNESYGELSGDVTTSGAFATTLGANFKRRGIAFAIGDPGASSALTAAATTTSYITVPFSCTISAYNLLVDAGTITVKFWKVATGTAIPTSTNSINTSGVSISSGTAIHSTTLTDFTATAVSQNDIMAMNVTAVATAKYVSGVLECDQ